MFFDSKTLDELAGKLADTMPSGLNHLKTDMEKNCRAILQSAIGHLDLVTREEFEVQKLVLSKTRTKLEILEKRIAELEDKLLSKDTL